MIDAIVNDNQEQMEVDFHSASTDIVRSIIGVPTEPAYDTVDDEGEEEHEGEETD